MDNNIKSFNFYLSMIKSMLTLLCCLTISIQTFAHDPATEMAKAAENFLNSLDDTKKKKAFYPFMNK